MIEVDDPAKLNELIDAQQVLFEAQAAARSSENPEESGIEGGGDAAEATANVERVAKDLGVEGCASV